MRYVAGIAFVVLGALFIYGWIEARRAERQHREMHEAADKKRFERGFGDQDDFI